MRQSRWWWIFVCCTTMVACSEYQRREVRGAPIQGKWIEDQQGQVMLNPQTSGLKAWRGKLMSVSDGSAHDSQLQSLHIIAPETAILEQPIRMRLSEKVQGSCFGQYLADRPDYEALAINPNDDTEVFLVTEDATRTGQLTDECQSRFANSGSTDYPTLLVRVKIQDRASAEITDVRPLRYGAEFAVGNFPNDGIEGLAMSPRGELFLGLEKDIEGKARVFKLDMDETFWQSGEFADVTDPQLRLPPYEGGNHPVNGMDYVTLENGDAYLVAAARNDDQIWYIDVSGQRDTVIDQIHFLAPNRPGNAHCGEWDVMDNSSLEGVAVAGNTVWLVNDPWKRHYHENIVCENNKAAFEAMAPLLFHMPLNSQKLSGAKD